MDAFEPPSGEARARQYQWGRAFRNVALVGLGLAVVMGTCVGVLVHKGGQLDASSKAYVDATIPLIVRNWDVNKAIEMSSPELLAATPREKLTALFASLARKLGPLKTVGGARGESNVSFRNGKTVTTAAYRARATFEKGPAIINVKLIRHGEQWQILGVFVNSELLMK